MEKEPTRLDQARIRKLTRDVEADMRHQRQQIKIDSDQEAMLRRKMFRDVKDGK